MSAAHPWLCFIPVAFSSGPSWLKDGSRVLDEDFPGDFLPREPGTPHKGHVSPFSQNNAPLGKKIAGKTAGRKGGREERRSEEQIGSCKQEKLPGQNSKGRVSNAAQELCRVREVSVQMWGAANG